MNVETIEPGRGTPLRKNDTDTLNITIPNNFLNKIIIINGPSLFIKQVIKSKLIILPNDYYMIVNKGDKKAIYVHYNQDVSNHEIIYDPYKNEKFKKTTLKSADFIRQFNVPEGYIDVLSKWYSIKFTYPKYNLIFIKPGMGLSFQVHESRNEFWKILGGKPIIISGTQVFYFVKRGSTFEIPINTIHSIINVNDKEYVMLKENWTGKFDEEDITRIFNPNNYS